MGQIIKTIQGAKKESYIHYTHPGWGSAGCSVQVWELLLSNSCKMPSRRRTSSPWRYWGEEDQTSDWFRFVSSHMRGPLCFAFRIPEVKALTWDPFHPGNIEVIFAGETSPTCRYGSDDSRYLRNCCPRAFEFDKSDRYEKYDQNLVCRCFRTKVSVWNVQTTGDVMTLIHNMTPVIRWTFPIEIRWHGYNI